NIRAHRAGVDAERPRRHVRKRMGFAAAEQESAAERAHQKALIEEEIGDRVDADPVARARVGDLRHREFLQRQLPAHRAAKTPECFDLGGGTRRHYHHVRGRHQHAHDHFRFRQIGYEGHDLCAAPGARRQHDLERDFGRVLEPDDGQQPGADRRARLFQAFPVLDVDENAVLLAVPQMRRGEAGAIAVIAVNAYVGLGVASAGSAASVLECHPLEAGLTRRERAVGVAVAHHALDAMLGCRRYDVGYLVALAAPDVDPCRRHRTRSWLSRSKLVEKPIWPLPEAARGGVSVRWASSMDTDMSRLTSRTLAAGSAAMKMLRPAASPRAPLVMTSATKAPNW